MSTDILTLHPRDGSGHLRVVVESPRGSRVKLKYDSELRIFCLSRPLVLGVAYPFDWGFVPGTRAADGDPVDAMVLFDAGSFPGVLIPCRALALLEVEQNAKKGGRERNDRIIVEPATARRSATPLTPRVRQELEAFFVSVTLFEQKDIKVLGWGSGEEAEALVDRSGLAV
jgi:inorganic pyrophosphatase